MEVAIKIRNLQKSFGSVIFQDLNLDIAQGEITAIFGPNGSGKSTLLNILSGVLSYDGGEFTISNLNRFRFSYIFQDYRESLLPWKTNFDNVALPLKLQGVSTYQIEQRVAELAKIFALEINWQGYPRSLSGGQQQMLAFVRALITNPTLLFIDEPFSALDYENNLRLRSGLQHYHLAHKPTIVLITHNIEEAVHVADQIVMLSKKPTRVSQTFTNPLPHPRTVEALKTPAFHQAKDLVLSAFQQTTHV